MTNLTTYEAMSGLSTQMVEAAQANDWDRLVLLEHQVARLRDQLIILEPAGRPIVPFSQEDRSRKVTLIKKLLADDREVRRHTEPWMDAVRKLLAGNTRERNLRAAYGVPQR
ncbi:MAG: flagellar protein FliT [Zoogloea sp.]|nr:flagellar protein FliT [Zoogloea sp.]